MAQQFILIVDDEKPLLALLQKYLERGGYCVDVCEFGADAIAAVRAAPGKYAVVILDLKLPDMTGAEVMDAILAEDPWLRILISSGSPFSRDGVAPELRERVDAILKPYLPKALLEAVTGLARAVSA